MKNILGKLLLNLLILSLLLFTCEIAVWITENNNLLKQKDEMRLNNGMFKFHSGIKHFKLTDSYFSDKNYCITRPPAGLNFTKKPIAVFGCSYAYGYRLNNEQTLSYKLSQLSRRPVYNRAYPGWGIQHMLFQAKLPILYNQVPEPEFVIYIFMNDHLRRLYLLTFMSNNMLNENFNLRFKEKNNSLVIADDFNPFINFFRRLYITNELDFLFVKYITLRKSNENNYYNFALKHFIESKKEMQKRWKNSKFVIFFYNDLYSENKLKEKLENEGFIVLGNYDLSNENLSDKKYLSDDYHPKEDAWNLLTPLLVKKLNL